jgi:predicted Zn-dependent peptidase
MPTKTLLTRLLHTGVVASLALSAPITALADDDPDLTVYKEGSVPLKKPEMKLRPIREYNVQGQMFNFPTGLRIFMQPDNTHPIITVHSITDHGSGSDPEGKGGLAHFTEHAWFKSRHDYIDPVTGDPRPDVFPSLKIMDMQSYIGATMNAYTKADTTEYMTTASAEFKNLLMQYESWRLTEPYRDIEEGEIDVEVNVILNEWRRRNEQDDALVWDYLFQAVYPEGHPYTGRSTKETLEAIELEDLQQFFDDNYTPAKTTIVVVGDFDPIQASSMIFSNFDWEVLDPRLDKEKDRWIAPMPGIENPDENNPDHWIVGAFDPTTRDLPREERPRYQYVPNEEIEPRLVSGVDPATPPDADQEVLTQVAPVPKDTVVVAWALPGSFREDSTDMLMTGYMASIAVNWELERKYDVRGEPHPYPDLDFKFCTTYPAKVNSTVLCRATFDPEVRSASDAADKLASQVSKIWDPGFTRQLNNLFVQVRNQMMMDTLFNVDDVANPFGGRAATVAETLHFTGNPNVHSSRIQDAASVSVDRIAEIAERYLKRNRYGVLHMQPMSLRERDTKSAGSDYAGASAEDDLVDDKAENTDLYTPERVAESWVEPNFDGIEEFKLENGLRVVVHRHGTAPIVSAMLMIGGGSRMSPTELYEFFKTGTRSDFEFDSLRIGAFEGQRDYNFHQARSVKVLAGNLDGGLYALRYWADTLHPETGGLGEYVRDRKKSLKKLWNTESWHSAGVRNEVLYPNHPYGKRTTLDDLDQMKAWGRSKLSDMIDNRMRPENATLVIVGDVDKEEMRKLAYETFSSWSSKGEMEPIETLPDPDMPKGSPRVVLTDSPALTQSNLRSSCRLNYRGREDDEAVSLLSSIVRTDVFGDLRVKEGLAYSPGGNAYPVTDKAAVMNFYALATNAGVARVVEYFRDWASRHEEEGFSEEKIRTFKMRLARKVGVQAQSTDQLADLMGSVIDAGETWEGHLQTGERIAAVEASDLQRLLEGCSDHIVTTITGPADTIEPLLIDKDIDFETLEWKNARDDIYMEQDPKGFVKFEKEAAKTYKKKRKEYTKACAKDSEARECTLLEVLEEDWEEEQERKAERKKGE